MSLRTAGLAGSTRDQYLRSLHQSATFVVHNAMPAQVASLRREQVECFLADLSERIKRSTIPVQLQGSAAVLQPT